jgi:hypothetical protein
MNTNRTLSKWSWLQLNERPAARAAILAILLVLWLALPAVVQAQFTYTINNGTVTITKYTGPGGAVTIPGTINGLLVTSIGNWAFNECTYLTGVTIPSSVSSIGDAAFNYCTNLAGVTIPGRVTSIGDYAFNNCAHLSSVTIGGGVTRIGLCAFAGCAMPSVTIPGSVTEIRSFAFTHCQSLTSVTIPNSVTSLGLGAFAECSHLTAISVGAGNPVYGSVGGVVFDKSQTTLLQFPGVKGSVPEFRLISILRLCSVMTSSAFQDFHSHRPTFAAIS